MAYSVDLRERMLANLDEETMRRTAKRFRMSLSSVYRIKRHYEETGQLQAKKPRGRLPAIDAEGEAWALGEGRRGIGLDLGSSM